MSLAVSDACFLINWASYRRRWDLLRAFSRLIVPRIVFVEVRSQPARDFLARLLATKRLLLAPRVSSIDSLALRIFETVNSDPSMPSIDPPEAYALALAAHLSVPLLTDNAAPKLAACFIEELKGAKVMDSLDVLALLYSREELRERVNEFTQDTGLIFSKRRLEEYGLG